MCEGWQKRVWYDPNGFGVHLVTWHRKIEDTIISIKTSAGRVFEGHKSSQIPEIDAFEEVDFCAFEGREFV
jgi:hypothetical protein